MNNQINNYMPDNTLPRILIVDDETKNIQVLGTLLRQKNYSINVAQTGKDALKIVKEVKPDIILLDVMMPKIDGFEACKCLKSMPEFKDIPVIFLTVKSEVTDIIKGFEVGAADYITKPFNAVELMARVETHLHLQMLKKNLEKKNAELTEINKNLQQEIIERQQTEVYLRESKERFRKLIKYGPDAIFVLKNNADILIVNQKACKNLGYSQKELLSMNMKELTGDLIDSLNNNKIFWNKISDNKIKLIETKYNRKDGSSFPAEVRLVQTQLDGKNVIIAFARNIQARKQRETEQLRIKKLEAMAVLAGGIAHDFNNLLFIIAGYISLIEAIKDDDNELLSIIKKIENATFCAADLTRELITFSQGGEPIKQPNCFYELINDVLLSLKITSGSKIDIDIDKNLWTAEFDENQIKQVLKNIILNADEAMAYEGIIKISAKNFILNNNKLISGILVNAGKYIQICVQDQGCGIPEKDIFQIFDPYFSTKDRGSRKGMGLGLAISHSIITKHNGAIIVESKISKGTKFKIFIPAIDKKITDSSDLSDKDVSQKIKKILVMEDEDMVRDTMQYMLESMEHKVETAKHGAEALKKYKHTMNTNQPFDFVILDLVINEGMGGQETMKALLELNPDIKAVISSAYYDDPVMADFKKYGFCDVISKPYNVKKLKQVIGNI